MSTPPPPGSPEAKLKQDIAYIRGSAAVIAGAGLIGQGLMFSYPQKYRGLKLSVGRGALLYGTVQLDRLHRDSSPIHPKE